MLSLRHDPDIHQEVECLAKKISAQLESTIEDQVNYTCKAYEETKASLLEAANQIWDDYCSILYGVSYTEVDNCPILYVSQNLDHDLTYCRKRLQHAELRRMLQEYKSHPTVAAQPIIYMHRIPRHKSEILYFDSPGTFFSFLATRAQSGKSEQSLESVWEVEVGSDLFQTTAADTQRVMNSDGKKHKRQGTIRISEFRRSYWVEETGDAFSLIDYDVFLKGRKAIEENKDIFAMGVDVIAYYIFERIYGHKDLECLKYLPYLFFSLFVHLQIEKEEMKAELENYIANRDCKKDVSQYFQLPVRKGTMCLSEEWLQYFVLWISFLKKRGRTVIRKVKDSLPKEDRANKSSPYDEPFLLMETTLSKLSPEENLNLMIRCMLQAE